jgi:S1-C subfamily serine protease
MYEATYNKEGKFNGIYTSWYPTGKMQKKAEYKNGTLVNNKYTLYDEKEQTERIFNETFDNNQNKWDVSTTADASMSMSNGTYLFTSRSKNQVASVVNVTVESEDYSIEAQIKKLNGGNTARYGLILGMKDFDNFLYFIIDNWHYKIAGKVEGIYSVLQDWTAMPKLKKEDNALLKILKRDNEMYFSLNGNALDRTEAFMLPGNNFGFFILDPCELQIDNFIVKEFNPSTATTSNVSADDANVKKFGSGFIVSKKGYIVTNHHVVEGGGKIAVEVNLPGGNKTFNAKVVVDDDQHDLAILQISDTALVSLPEVPYDLKSTGISVGETVFALGYPLALVGMGKEVKFTDGKISSKTGYNNSLSSYQITVPVQPGNSGGPLFDNNGQLIGIINASIRNADNVSYAVKTDYLKVLLEVLPDPVTFSLNPTLKDKTLSEKIHMLSQYVTLVKIK